MGHSSTHTKCSLISIVVCVYYWGLYVPLVNSPLARWLYLLLHLIPAVGYSYVELVVLKRRRYFRRCCCSVVVISVVEL